MQFQFKPLIIISIFILSFSGIKAQSFEGTIHYAITVKSKVKEVTDTQFKQALGSVQDLYIKENCYKTVTPQSGMEWQIYRGDQNKLYSKYNKSTEIQWNNGDKASDVLQAESFKKEAGTVAGLRCDKWMLTYESATYTFYFHPKWAVDPLLFAAEKYGYWYDFISRSKAIPLKIVIENSQFKMTLTAQKINPKIIDPLIFELPAGVPLTESPF